MNKSYRLVFNEITRTWVAVSEIAKAGGKRASGAVLLAAAGFITVQPAPAFAASPSAPAATALPTGGNVVAGQATISQSTGAMTVTQTTQRAAIDWQTFNIGNAASVNFVQPSSSSAILNRVLDPNPSQIFGRLTSNGQVFLTNASGIYFGQSANVNVGALTATTHSISNHDFMAGNHRFTRNGATGSVINEGNISADLNGYIALLAPEVRNSGVVVAQMGTVALAAGEAFELQFDGTRLANIRVEPATIAALVENGNAVQTPGGLIILSAQASNRLQGGVVNNTGSLEATGLVDNGGTIRLEASQRIEQSGTLDASGSNTSTGPGAQGGSIRINTQNLIDSGTTLASGAQQGGSITVQASDSVRQTTSARASVDGGAQAGQLRITAGTSAWLSGRYSAQGARGGDIALSAPALTLAEATLNASGASAGGSIRIGGGWHGQDASLPNAKTTDIVAGSIDASARVNGSGGTVVVWSDEQTRFDGAISARGGVQGGNGGFVETSGKHKLAITRGTVDVGAPLGKGGNWLLDPDNITVEIGGGAAYGDVNDTNTGTGSSSSVAPATLEAVGGDVILAATNSITVNDAISLTGTHGLTLQAGSRIDLNANITTVTGAVSMTTGSAGLGQAAASTVNAGSATITIDGGGPVALNGSLTTTNATASAIAITNATTLQIGNLSADAAGTIALSHSGAGTQAASTAITSGNLVKQGTGTLTLSGANTYTGKTSVQAGSLSVGTLNSVAGGSASSNLGAPTTVSDGTIDLGSGATTGTLVYTGSGQTTDRVINLAGTTGGGTISQSGIGLLKFTSAVTATGAGSKTLTLQGSTAGTGELAGVVADNSVVNMTGLTKLGSGTWTLSGTNTYTGVTTINAGVLSVSTIGTTSTGATPVTTAGNLGKATNSAANLVLGGGTLQLTGSSYTTKRGFTLTAGTMSNIEVSQSSATLELGGAPTDTTGALNMIGPGTLRLLGGALGTTSFSGGLTIKSGTVNCYSAGTNAGCGTGTITLGDSAGGSNAATIVMGSNGVTYTNPFVLASNTTGALTIAAGGAGGTSILSGGVTGANNLIFSTPMGGISGTLNHSGTITYSGSSGSNTNLSATIGSNVTGLVVDSATTNVRMSGANTSFSSGIIIKSGTVTALTDANALGTGAVTIGDSAGGSKAAKLLIGTDGLTIANPIVLASSTTGTLSIGNSGTAISGTYSGGVTGTNNLTINSGGTTGTVTFSTAALNNVGTITNIGTGTGTTMISAAVGSNVTGIIENSTTSALTVSGTLAVNSVGTTLTNANATANKKLILSGDVTGTGNLTLNNNDTTANAITLSGTTVNNTGTITNSGSGSSVLISAAVGSNVAGIIENSTASALTVSGALTVNSAGTTLTNRNSAGSAVLTLSGGVGGSGDLVVKNNSSITNGVTVTNGGGGINNMGTVTNSGSGTGAESTSATIGNNVTGVIQNSTTSALTLNGQLNVNSAGTTLTNSAGGQLLTLTGNVLGTGDLILNNNSSTASGVSLNGNASVFVNNNGTIINSGSGSGSVVISAKIGPNGTSNVTGVVENSATSQLILSGANTYTGTTTVSAGTLSVNGTAITDTSAVTVASGATLALSASETIGSLAGAGNVTLGANTLSAGGNNTSTTFSGTASGSGGLTKAGTGAWTLSGANSYTGTTTVSAGTLMLGHSSALGSTSAASVTSGATLDLNGTTLAGTIPLTLNGTGVGGTAGALTNSAATVASYSGAITLGSDSSIAAGSGNELSAAGTIDGAFALDVLGGGSVTLGASVGNSTPLGSFSGAAGTAVSITGGTVKTSGAQTYRGTTTFGVATTLAAGSINASGAVTATSGTLTLNTGAGNATFSNTGNDFATVVVGNAANLTLVDANALTLAGINATGLIDVRTQTNDLTLTSSIATTNGSSAAISLNAGSASAARTSTGGNILISGGTLGMGTGGRATLYTGSIADSTGVTALVGSGSGKFRYGSNASTNHYTAALGAGTYAIYREQPTLTFTTNSPAAIAYGSAAPSYVSSVAGERNGDTVSQALTTLASVADDGLVSGSGHLTAGSHLVSAYGAVDQFGYALNYVAGALTVNKVSLLVTGLTASSKTYDSTTTASLGGVAAISALAGDTVTLGGTASGAFTDKNVGTAKAVTVTGKTIGGADAGNYTLVQQSGLAADIGKANATVTGNSGNVTYNGQSQSVSGFTASGLVNGELATVLTGVSATGSGTNAGSYNVEPIGTDGNYNLTLNNGTLAIARAELTVTANTDSKGYDGLRYNGGNGVTYAGFVNGETTNVLGGGLGYAGNSQGAINAGSYSIAPNGLNSVNYKLRFVDGVLSISVPPPVSPAVILPPLPTPSTNPPLLSASSGEASSGTSVSGSQNGQVTSGNSSRGGLAISMVREASVQSTGLITVSVPKEMASAGNEISFPLPIQLVSAVTGNNAVISVTTISGGVLPAWLKFNSETKTIVASAVPDGAFPMQVVVTINGQSTTVVISKQTEE